MKTSQKSARYSIYYIHWLESWRLRTTLLVAKHKIRTKTIKKTLDPEWNQQYDLKDLVSFFFSIFARWKVEWESRIRYRTGESRSMTWTIWCYCFHTRVCENETTRSVFMMNVFALNVFAWWRLWVTNSIYRHRCRSSIDRYRLI